MHTSPTHSSARTRRGTLLALALTLGAASTATAATPPPTSPDRAPAPVLQQAANAMAKARGIKISEARAQLVREKSLGDKGARIEKALDGRTGGSFLDENGELVVTALDAAAKAEITASGARAKLVDDSEARLESVMRELNRHAAQHGPGKTQGWRVDVPTNTVVLTVTQGATDAQSEAMKKLASGFGDSVRLEPKPADQAAEPAEWMVGGYEFVPASGGTCSVGFNTVDASSRPVVLTAGHCIASGMNSRNGFWVGNSRSKYYPGDDFGTFWNAYPSYWQPSPSVYRYENGTYPRVLGYWNNPPIGTTVCKSGRTTFWTCGRITAVNQTVVYTKTGDVLYGLTRHSACVEPGDSGGANVSADGWALGVTSGSAMRYDLCLSKFGEPNVGYYQPIGEALSREGLRLL